MDLTSIIIRIFTGLVCMCFGAWFWALNVGEYKFYSLLGVVIAVVGLIWFYWTLIEIVF